MAWGNMTVYENIPYDTMPFYIVSDSIVLQYTALYCTRLLGSMTLGSRSSACPGLWGQQLLRASHAGHVALPRTVGASRIPILWSQIPNMAIVSYTSDIPRNDVDNSLGVHTRPAVGKYVRSRRLPGVFSPSQSRLSFGALPGGLLTHICGNCETWYSLIAACVQSKPTSRRDTLPTPVRPILNSSVVITSG